MVSKLFVTKHQNKADAINASGNKAYNLSAKTALAQLACTGCFNDTFYVKAEDQLTQVLELAKEVPLEFLAKTAIYARKHSKMKDMPALLLAILSKDLDLFTKTFPYVVDDLKMLRHFVQMIRSGVTGRKSLASCPKRMSKQFLDSCTDEQLFYGSIGNSPSLSDVIKIVHPKPIFQKDHLYNYAVSTMNTRQALYGWLIGIPSYQEWYKTQNPKQRWYKTQSLPRIVQEFEDFKKNPVGDVPKVSFEMLSSLSLTPKQWAQIATNASWTQTRMNLNTFLRHGVFNEPGMDKIIAEKLKNQKLIEKEKPFPYQLLVAYLNCDEQIPKIVKNALQEALELATKNVPAIDGKIYICPDVSGSMSSPITGERAGSTTKVKCIDVAALIASSLLRINKEAEVIPFERSVVNLELNAFDSIMTNTIKLASINGSSTNCSAPLAKLNTIKAKGNVVIYISDYESNVDLSVDHTTPFMNQWRVFKARNPKAKLVCIDLTPNSTVQNSKDKDILNIGGFSDSVFDIIASFVESGSDPDYWVKKIEEISF